MTNATFDLQTELDLRPEETVRDAYERIQREATSNTQKGTWFEHLFMECVRNLPEFDVDEIWTGLEMAKGQTDTVRARTNANRDTGYQ